jgi:hypothetical protein
VSVRTASGQRDGVPAALQDELDQLRELGAATRGGERAVAAAASSVAGRGAATWAGADANAARPTWDGGRRFLTRIESRPLPTGVRVPH